jgi:hypothetical protein
MLKHNLQLDGRNKLAWQAGCQAVAAFTHVTQHFQIVTATWLRFSNDQNSLLHRHFRPKEMMRGVG